MSPQKPEPLTLAAWIELLLAVAVAAAVCYWVGTHPVGRG
jgi:hypothetical protein